MISKITPLLMILVIASILGYMTENIWVGLRFGYWDNRGMMMPGLLGNCGIVSDSRTAAEANAVWT